MVCVGCNSVDGFTQRVEIRVNLQLSSPYFAHLFVRAATQMKKKEQQQQQKSVSDP